MAINPLAIGVTLGGLLLDILVPKPKPEAGVSQDTVPSLSRYGPEAGFDGPYGQYERPPVASGASR